MKISCWKRNINNAAGRFHLTEICPKCVYFAAIAKKTAENGANELSIAHCELYFTKIRLATLEGSIMKRLAVSLLSTAAVGLGFATMASAADLGRPAMPTKAPAMLMVDDWAGFYLGGHLGAAWSRSGYTYNVNGVAVDAVGFSPDSFMGGGHLGLQGQWGTWVLGIEGSFDGTDLSQTSTGAVNRQSLKIDEIATVTGRLGYAAMPGWLLYVKGGWAGVRSSDSSVDIATATVTHSFSGWNSGYTVGGGIEYKVTRNWIVGAEFDFYNTKFDRSGLNSPTGAAVATVNSNADIYAVLFRASYLFK